MSGVPEWATTSDGVRLAVERAGPPQAAVGGDDEPAVVLVHGFAAHRHHPDVVAVRDALVEDGFVVYSFDLRGHGESEGECTLGDSEEHDVAAVVGLAGGRHGRIVLVSASMGAVAALRFAAGVEGANAVAGVVAVSSPAMWRLPLTPRGWFSAVLTRTRLGRRVLAGQGVRVAKKWTGPEPPVALVERIKAPVAFIHGQRDRWIHPMASLHLHRVVREQRKLELVAGMGHAFHPLGIPAIRAAVAWVLRESAVPTP